MPFIEEEKFKLMQEDLDNAKLKREEAEEELTKVQEEYASHKKSSRLLPILMGVLLGPALAAAYYFYTNQSGSMSDSELASIKKKESVRVIDSIKRAEARARRNGKTTTSNDSQEEVASFDTEAAKSSVDNATNNETVYSVQIGVFSENRYPLLSSQYTAGIAAPVDEFFKYSVGLFSSLDEAKKLRAELRRIGFKDAFVASYVNGKRQKIHH